MTTDMPIDESRYPDIEIYLAKASIDDLDDWLRLAIQADPLAPSGKHQWRSRGRFDHDDIPVLLVEKAADGFASLWFDSSHTPWETDRACARAAAAHLGCEIRCSLGGWQPGDDPDRFLRVCSDGREEEFIWPDSGH